MNWIQKAALALILCAVGMVALAPGASADNIKVINAGVSGHGMVQNAVNYLTNLGHNVTTGGTLADYSSFDQVWDLRFATNLGAADIAAMGSYLAQGGCMYMTGEWNAFDSSRNLSLRSWINAVGGGTISLTTGQFNGTERVTAAGQIVNQPNPFATVSYIASRQVQATATNGFLVTSNDNLNGSLVGWDFGDINGAGNARMLVGFDIEIFNATNGQNWTDNMATYLGKAAVPEPSSFALLALGAAGLIVVRRRKRA